MSFDNDTRNLLARTVSSARALLTTDVQAQLQANYGLYPDGRRLTIAHTPAAQQAAAELTDLWDHFAANEPANPQSPTANLQSAYQRLVREIGFTLLNRLAALRLCEERGIVIECVGKGMQSAGFQLYDRLANGALGNRYQTYRAFLEGLFDELALDLGALFARDLPQSHIFPGETTLTDLLALLNEPELARRQVWQSDETIGWIYQYYNDPEERRSMRQASSAPRNSRELAVRNQFFTPRYVVEFLTDNTLGRIWYEMMQGQTALAEECRYLVRRPIEVFLNDPDEYLKEGCRPWVRRARQGDFSDLPDDPAESELACISFAFNGYEVAERIEGYRGFMNKAGEQIDRFTQGGQLPTNPLDLWLLLFAMQRSWRIIVGSGPAPRDFLDLWRNIYLAWRDAVSSKQLTANNEQVTDDSDPSEIRNPKSEIAFVPFRKPKDPREIKMLDPACGSMHFGLYAFDLFSVIYEEGWQQHLIEPEEFGYRPQAVLRSETVRPDPQAVPLSNYGGQRLAFEKAYVVVTRQSDGGDGIEANVPYLVDEAKRFRVPFDFRQKLAEFDYPAALRAGWFSQEAGEQFVRHTSAFTYSEQPVVSHEEAFANFRRQIPRLIIEHNIHGIDIDPRAVQIAALALWLRAQRAWGEMGLRPTERPRIRQTHIVTAEPMPGDKTLLAEFSRDLRPRVLGQLAEKIFDKMKLAGEAGSLLKIEVELAAEIAAAKKVWLEQSSRAEQLALLPDLRPAKARQMGLFDVRDVTDEEFWRTAETQLLDALRQYTAQAGRRRLFAHDAAQGFALIDLCQGQYDVVLMNPPFGEGSAQAKSYLGQAYPISKNDVYAAFVERWLGRLQPNGRLGAITSRTGFFLSSFRRWREEVLLAKAPPVVVADLGYGVLDAAMVETAAYVCSPILQNRTTPLLFLRLLEAEDKAAACSAILRAILQNRTTGAFSVSAESLRQVPGAPFAYWVSDQLRGLFQSLPPFASEGRTAKQGLATADDFRFVRTAWETAPEQVGERWFPFVKGGNYSPYYTNISLQVNWGEYGKEMKAWADPLYNNSGWSRIIKSVDYYFRPGFTWPLRGIVFSSQVVPSGCVFSIAGKMAFVPEEDLSVLLGLFNSKAWDSLIAFFAGKVGGVQYEVGLIQQIPIPHIPENARSNLTTLTRDAWLNRWLLDTRVETSHAFHLPALLQNSGATLAARAAGWGAFVAQQEAALARLQTQIDDLCFDLYAISPADRQRITQGFGAASDDDESDEDEDEAETAEVDLPALAASLLSWYVGTAMGRFDIRWATTPDLPAPAAPDPFAPLPICAAGLLLNPTGLPATPDQIVSAAWLRARPDANSRPRPNIFAGPATIPNNEYPISFPWDGILVDDPGLEEQTAHPWDIVSAVQRVLSLLWPDSYPAIEAEACEILGVRSLRDYFRKWGNGGFFDDHLKRYSKSRRKAPIYWPLSTASGRYTLWLYYQRLNEEKLYTAINKYVEPKIQQVERRLAHWEQTLHELGGKAATERRDAITDLRDFLAELRAFRDELLRVAGLPYKPNLNDGVIINAAPLHRLHPHRKWAKDTEAIWKKLEKGEYDWAHLAYTIWPGRVREVCRKDRSIAIAHGLEGLCSVPVKGEGKGKATKGRSKKRGAQQATLALDGDQGVNGEE